jgi:hypothetical protein
MWTTNGRIGPCIPEPARLSAARGSQCRRGRRWLPIPVTDAAVGYVRAAVPPQSTVAAATYPNRSPTPCQRLTSRSYLGRIDHWHARLASGPLQLVPLGATPTRTPRSHSNSDPSGPTPTRTPRGPLQLVPLGATPTRTPRGPLQLVHLGATPTRTPRGPLTLFLSESAQWSVPTLDRTRPYGACTLSRTSRCPSSRLVTTKTSST